MNKIVFRADIFEEDDQYVGFCPELEVSSFADMAPEAKVALQEAAEAFLEGCESLGTLEESGTASG